MGPLTKRRAALLAIVAIGLITLLIGGSVEAERSTYTKRMVFINPGLREFDQSLAGPQSNVDFSAEVLGKAARRAGSGVTPQMVEEAIAVSASAASDSVAITANADSLIEAQELAAAFAEPFLAYRRRIMLEKARLIRREARRELGQLDRRLSGPDADGANRALSDERRAEVARRVMLRMNLIIAWVEAGNPSVVPGPIS